MTAKDIVNTVDPTLFKCKCTKGWVSKDTMVCDRCDRIFNIWTDQDGARLEWIDKNGCYYQDEKSMTHNIDIINKRKESVKQNLINELDPTLKKCSFARCVG